MRGALAAVVAAVVLSVAPMAGAEAHDDDGHAVTMAAASLMAPCKWDDGSGSGRRPCVWDARHMGNGIGRSFVAIPVFPFRGTDPVVRYVSHRKAHRYAFGSVR
jgi:hypothetical protein